MTTVLIADDDPILRATVSEHLGREGYRVLEAADGEEALACMRTVGVDLLILDMLMPNKDGLETILDLRKAGATLPILAISSGGKMDKSTLLKPAMVFGANQTMAKPIRRETLVEAVANLLAERHEAGGAAAPEALA